jgi:O-antigen/teichoic acid export membrane protein
MFVVIPRLADSPAIYGIYVIAISTNIFLTYGDFGFISAGQKYVSECFARRDLEEEIKITGFVCFVLFIFVLIFSVVVLVIAAYPQLLITKISNLHELTIASHIFFILAIFCPAVVGQRFLDITYGARIEQYIYQRISIVGSLLKIFSVLYFFDASHYDIIGYFLFCQVINLLVIIFSAAIIWRRYNYDYGLLLRSFKFTREIFDRTRKLAFASFFLTFAFILYYEMDSFVIARLLGLEKVAVYAIGLTILTFLRNVYAVIYSPFLSRFNHFIGLNDMDGLRGLCWSVIILTIPLVFFPIVSLIILMKPLIYTWLGVEYKDSIIIAQLLIAGFIFIFVANPTSFLIIAQERIKELNLTSAIQPIIYWCGVLLTVSSLGLTSFALFKFITFSINAVIYLFIALNFLRSSTWNFFIKAIRPLIIPIIFLLMILLFLEPLLSTEKGIMNLIVVILTGAGSSLGALCLYYCFSELFRKNVSDIFKTLAGAYVFR